MRDLFDVIEYFTFKSSNVNIVKPAIEDNNEYSGCSDVHDSSGYIKVCVCVCAILCVKVLWCSGYS